MIDATGRASGDLLVERYTYEPGPAVALPRHSHDDYQLCLNPDFVGQVWLAGSWHTVPRGRLTVVAPGETHAVRDPADRTGSGTYRVLYVSPSLAATVAGQAGAVAAFRGLVQADGALTAAFHRLHLAIERHAPALERESLLWTVLGALARRYGAHRPVPAERVAAGAGGAVYRVRDYLHDNLAENVSLADLARVANLSGYHLLRSFRREFGLPPHTYQVQARIDRARWLLARGHTATAAAYDTGFFDPSHFTRHFRRIVGVTPGRYRR